MNKYFYDEDANKVIVALYARPQYKGHKGLLETNARVIAFRTSQQAKIDAWEARKVITQKVQKEALEIAAESLKAKGEIPDDYVVK